MVPNKCWEIGAVAGRLVGKPVKRGKQTPVSPKSMNFTILVRDAITDIPLVRANRFGSI